MTGEEIADRHRSFPLRLDLDQSQGRESGRHDKPVARGIHDCSDRKSVV